MRKRPNLTEQLRKQEDQAQIDPVGYWLRHITGSANDTIAVQGQKMGGPHSFSTANLRKTVKRVEGAFARAPLLSFNAHSMFSRDMSTLCDASESPLQLVFLSNNGYAALRAAAVRESAV